MNRLVCFCLEIYKIRSSDLNLNRLKIFNIDDFEFENNFAVQKILHGFKRMVAMVTLFFMPELVKIIGTRIFSNFSFMRKIFWTVIENREKTGEKRGDFIDLLLQIKNDKQNPIYSK